MLTLFCRSKHLRFEFLCCFKGRQLSFGFNLCLCTSFALLHFALNSAADAMRLITASQFMMLVGNAIIQLSVDWCATLSGIRPILDALEPQTQKPTKIYDHLLRKSFLIYNFTWTDSCCIALCVRKMNWTEAAAYLRRLDELDLKMLKKHEILFLDVNDRGTLCHHTVSNNTKRLLFEILMKISVANNSKRTPKPLIPRTILKAPQ